MGKLLFALFLIIFDISYAMNDQNNSINQCISQKNLQIFFDNIQKLKTFMKQKDGIAPTYLTILDDFSKNIFLLDTTESALLQEQIDNIKRLKTQYYNGEEKLCSLKDLLNRLMRNDSHKTIFNAVMSFIENDLEKIREYA